MSAQVFQVDGVVERWEVHYYDERPVSGKIITENPENCFAKVIYGDAFDDYPILKFTPCPEDQQMRYIFRAEELFK